MIDASFGNSATFTFLYPEVTQKENSFNKTNLQRKENDNHISANKIHQ